MKERPILFSGLMVKAILAGRKTQTRRIIKATPIAAGPKWSIWWDEKMQAQINDHQFAKLRCPYGVPDDRLWVRETFCDHDFTLGGARLYRANGEFLEDWTKRGLKWRPAIFMPRSWSRITLEVTGIRVERLQDMPWQDAIAEGIEPVMCCSGIECGCQGKPIDDPTWAYRDLWDKINGKGSWESNPWIWVVSFKRINQ